MKRYFIEIYSGGTYCGNAIFDTLDECYEFANDGFCDYFRINDTETNKILRICLKESKI